MTTSSSETPPSLNVIAAAGAVADRGTAHLPQPRREPFDENLVRRSISFWLLWLLTGILALAFVALGIVFSSDATVEATRFAHLLALLQIVFGPMIALVSSVIGFYFGARTVADTRRE